MQSFGEEIEGKTSLLKSGCICGRIILKHIFKMCDGDSWTGLTYRAGGGPL